MNKGQFISGDQAIRTKKQHISPCSDCPFARKSLKGWLGSYDPIKWIQIVQGDGHIECHTRIDKQCAGSSIFRSNICKVSRDATVLQLKSDRIKVFSSPNEFISHHSNGKSKSW